MSFIPLQTGSSAGYPKVTPDQQAERDENARQLVAAEIERSGDDPPHIQEALRREYESRFGGTPPAAQPARRGFKPLSGGSEQAAGTPKAGFKPLADEPPSMLRTLALNNPLTAIGEIALNLASQSVALPVAGLAGLATEAGNALGLTEKKGADVVGQVADRLTYSPRGEMGKAATEAVMYPFEKLAEAGQYAGGKVLDATGSPALATAVDTAVNVLPMAISPAMKAAKKAMPRSAGDLVRDEPTHVQPVYEPQASRVHTEDLPPAMTLTTDGRLEPGLASSPEMPVASQTAEPARSSPTRPQEQAPVVAAEQPEAKPAIQPAESAPVDVHPTVQTADAIVRDLANEAGIPLETVLPEKPVSTVGDALVSDSLMLRPDVTQVRGFRPLADDTMAQEAPAMRAGDTISDKTGQPLGQAMEGGKMADAGRMPAATTDTPAAPIAPVTDSAPARLHPTRFSGRAFGDDVLAALADGATPEVLAEIQQEQRRRSVLSAETEPARVDEAHRAPAGDTQAATQAMAPGMNYVPLIDDAGLTAPAPRRAMPIRREDVLLPLVKSLGATIYQGRIKQRGVLGLYTRGKETVRIKRAADIEVAAHEIAHLLDDRIPEIRATWSTDPMKATYTKELKGVSYDHRNVKEGFAEFVRLYMTQPEQALTKAPEFSKWFEGFTNRHEYGPAIKKAQADMTAWFGQDAVDRARSKIGDRRNFNEAFDGIWDRFRQSTVDDLHGVYRMERDLKGGITPAGPYESARLSRASHSIAEGTINFGHPVRKVDGSITYAGKGLRQILEPVSGNLDDALLYFVGRSARELKQQGREHLFTDAEIKAMLALETPEARKAFQEYQQWNRKVVDFAEAAGVVNPASRAMWQRQAYMPFHRVGQPGGYSGKPGEWSGIKVLTGGTENLRDILGNMTSNAAMLIDKAVKNEARQKIAAMAEHERGAGKFMTRIPAESRPVKIRQEEVISGIIKALGIDKNDPLAQGVIADIRAQIESGPGMYEFFMGNQTPAGGNVVSVMEHGKPIYYEVADPVLYRALAAIDRPHQSWLVKWLGLPKRIGQTTITLTPDFMVANIARDTIMGSVMSRAGFRPIMDSLEGMRLRMTNDPLYRDYIANGGGLSSIYLDEGKLRARLEKFYRNQGIDYRTVLDAPDKLLGFVETLADAFETSTRLGEYKRAINGGENPRHAAYLAREVSTDFAMRGDSQALNFMYDTVMFLKPAALSFDRLYRGVAHDPNKGAIAAKAGTLALFSMGLYMLNRDDPRYQDLPDWDRDANWHFFVGDQHFRYPKIWEIGAMASVAERSLEKTLASDTTGLGMDLGRIIGQTFNLNLMPQILAPIYEQATNRNSFTKAAIETPGMENEQPFLRAAPGTSETLKAAGMATRKLPESMQINPVRTEALLRGYFNTWATYGLMLSDQALFGDNMPAMRADQMPVIRRFYAQEPAKHTKYESMYYDMLGEAKRLHGTLRALDKLGHKEIADEMESQPLAAEHRALNRANDRLRDINAEMREVRRDAKLTPDEKRGKLDALTMARNALLKSVVQESKAAQQGAK